MAPSLDTFLNVIRKDGGSVDKVDIWGKRRLAYEIHKKSEGIYAVINVKAAPATVSELDRQLEPERVRAAHQGAADRQALAERRVRVVTRLAAIGSRSPHDLAQTDKSRRNSWLATPSSPWSAT